MKIEVGKKYRTPNDERVTVKLISDGYVFGTFTFGEASSIGAIVRLTAIAESNWTELPPEPRKVPVYLYRDRTAFDKGCGEFASLLGPTTLSRQQDTLLATAEFVIPPEKEK